MPRRRFHRYRNFYGGKANNVWLPDMIDTRMGKGSSTGTDDQIKAGNVYKVHDMRVPLTDFETTFERIRGQLQTLGAGDLFNSVLYGYVHKNKSLTDLDNGTLMEANAVDPFIGDENQDVPIVIDLCAPLSTTSSQPRVGPNLTIDVKSKRKVEKDAWLTLFCKILSQLSTPNSNDYLRVFGALRTLWRFRI